MKYLSLILALIGLFLLSLLLISQKPIPISSLSQLEKQQENQKVIVSGYVIKEVYQKESKILTLDNNVKALCNNPCPDYLYKNISIEGIYDTFIEPRVIASKIKINN
jgi:hypothetical protein